MHTAYGMAGVLVLYTEGMEYVILYSELSAYTSNPVLEE
jgi:hypothetical protein